MRDRITRRRMLGALASVSAVALAGCGEPGGTESPNGDGESPIGEAEGSPIGEEDSPVGGDLTTTDDTGTAGGTETAMNETVATETEP